MFSPCSCRFRCIVGAIRHHVLLKLELTDSDLAYSAPDKNAIREVANQGYAPLSYAEVHDDFLLTASTEGPALEPSHYADRLFGEVGHYTPERGSPRVVNFLKRPNRYLSAASLDWQQSSLRTAAGEECQHAMHRIFS